MSSNGQLFLLPQLQKLGVLPFEEALGGSTLVSYQEMWANNGDTISKQYAGTAAMKVHICDHWFTIRYRSASGEERGGGGGVKSM